MSEVELPEPEGKKEVDCLERFFTSCAPLGLLVLILTILGALTWIGWSEVAEFLFDSVHSTEDKYIQALIINMVLVFTIVTAIPSPMLLMILNGFFFGLRLGFCLNFIAEMTGHMTSLLVARSCLRARLRGYLIRSPQLCEVVLMCEDDPNGLFLILVRFVTIPGWLKNYGIAILDIPVYRFALICIPAECLYSGIFAYVGSKAYNIAGRLRKGDTGAVLEAFSGTEVLLVGGSVIVALLILLMGSSELQRRRRRIEAGGSSLASEHTVLRT